MEASKKIDLESGKKKAIAATIGFFLLIEINLLLLDLVFNWQGLINYQPIRQLFNMELEASLANWISSLVYLSVGIAAWLIVLKEKYINKKNLNAFFWLIIALGFTYLAADDGAGIHERIGTTLKLLHDRNSWNPEYIRLHWIIKNFPSYYWQVVFVPVLAIFSIFSFIFFARVLNSKKLLFFIFLAFLIMAFAQCLDYLEGIHYSYKFLQDSLGFTYKGLRHFFKIFEEFLEMCGMNIILGVFMAYLFRGIKTIKLGS